MISSLRRMCVVASLCVVGLASVAMADVTGTYKWQQQGGGGGGAQEITLKLKQEGDKVTGTITVRNGETEISEGAVKGSEVTFKVVRDMNGTKLVTSYALTVSGDTIKGKSEQTRTAEIDGKKAAE